MKVDQSKTPFKSIAEVENKIKYLNFINKLLEKKKEKLNKVL